MTEKTRKKLVNALMDAVGQDQAFTPTLKMLINTAVYQFGCCTHQGVMAAMMTRLKEFQDHGEFDKEGMNDEN